MGDLGWDVFWDREQDGVIRRKEPVTRSELRRRLLERMPELARGGVIHPLKGGPLFRKLSDEWGVVEAEIADAAASLDAWPWTPKDVLKALRRARSEERRAKVQGVVA